MNQEMLVDHRGTHLYPQYRLCEIAVTALGSLTLILVNDGIKEAEDKHTHCHIRAHVGKWYSCGVEGHNVMSKDVLR
jgi:hypothetical protein